MFVVDKVRALLGAHKRRWRLDSSHEDSRRDPQELEPRRDPQQSPPVSDHAASPPGYQDTGASRPSGEPTVEPARASTARARVIRNYVVANGATEATVAHLLTTFEIEQFNPQSAAAITAALSRAGVEIDRSLEDLDGPDDQVVRTPTRDPLNR